MTEIAGYFSISRAVIRFNLTCSCDRRPGSSRHRVTSARVEKFTVSMSLRNRFVLSVVNIELQRVRGESYHVEHKRTVERMRIDKLVGLPLAQF